MKIAIDARCLTEARHSGIQEYTLQLIQGFLKIAPQHEYHLFYNAAHSRQLPHISESVIWHRWRYPNKLFNALQWSLTLPRWDRLVAADCFFAPNLGLLPLSWHTPFVVTVHDVSFARFPEFFDWRRRLWHSAMRPHALLSRASHLIAVSQATAADMQEIYGLLPAKISVIHSGVNNAPPPVTASQRAAVIDRYNLPERFVLYLGTHEPRKNLPSLIQAFSAVASDIPHHLVLAGSPGWLVHSIRAAYEASEYRHRIHLVGFIPEVDKATLYALADLFVYPSFSEGFGFPPLEALLAGTPVVTSMNSSLPEVVGKWATMIDPYHPGELALVIKELLREPQSVEQSVIDEIRQQFSWDTTARETIKVLEGVMESNKNNNRTKT